jgi:hypothetical protein
MRTLAATVALVALVTPSPALAWGFETHKFIVSRAIDVLPDELRPFFQANRAFVVEHCIDPDLWRTAGFADEPPRHFLNMDAYGPYPFTGLPRDYDAAVAKFGRETLSTRGLLPWRAWEMSGNLGRAFERHQRGIGSAAADVKFFAAIIGHYAADAHVPLHAVVNYDGQLSAQNGVHYRFEEELFVRYGNQLNVRPAPLQSIANVRDFVFDTLLESQQNVQALLTADREAIGNGRTYDDRYFDAFFAMVRPMLEKRLSQAISGVASVIASEWDRAGRPALPVTPPARQPAQRQP